MDKNKLKQQLLTFKVAFVEMIYDDDENKLNPQQRDIPIFCEKNVTVKWQLNDS